MVPTANTSEEPAPRSAPVIRAADETDAPALQRYAEALFSEGLPGINRRPIPTLAEEIEFVRSHGGANSVLLIAEVDGEVVGVAGFLGEELEERAHAGEFGVSVSRAYRDRGIGTALLNALFDWALRHGIRRIEGIAFATNERALTLYRRLGFEVEGRKVGALIRDGAEIDAFVIVKRIGGSAE